MHQPEDIYGEKALARLYDHFNLWGPGDEYYLDLARRARGPVLDLGCGTGMAAVRFAAEGIDMTGVEPAPGMLAVAKARAGAEKVTWVQARGQDLDLPRRCSLIYMTGHAFQTQLTDEDAMALLHSCARHLGPGGKLAFETRNPDVCEWLDWMPDLSRQTVDSGADGRIEASVEAAHDPATGIVALTHRYRLLDRGFERRGSSRIRFIGREHLERLLVAGGLRVIEVYGNWDRSPCGPRSPEIIVVAGSGG